MIWELNSSIAQEKSVCYLMVICLITSLCQVIPEVSKANGSHLLVDDKSKYKSMLVRAYSSIWMIGGFALIIYMGHLYITAMVVVIQIIMARELFNLLRRAHEDRQLPGFRLLNWYFLQIYCPQHHICSFEFKLLINEMARKQNYFANLFSNPLCISFFVGIYSFF